MWVRLTICVAALLVSGCDPIYGVESRATLSGPVDARCINAALASVVGAGRVACERSESRSTEIYPKQREVLTVMHVWSYGEGGSDILQINQTPDGWDYRNARSRMGSAVTDEEIARFQPLMLAVIRNRSLCEVDIPMRGLAYLERVVQPQPLI
ncbi:hypothetical protein ACQKKG_12230 [Brevundimonas sp. NPDC003935]|uniref:hypothetical protein n=1 Tax=unclassified Brevundimonas TaxID=2622653 RepID=UPI0025BFC3F5|nr:MULTISPECIES: hypothetical protein [unclassified Brevundimonas]